MMQFNTRQESFAEELARQKAAFKYQRREMDARSEEIRRRQEEADRRHREATLTLEMAMQLTRANAQTAAGGAVTQGANNNDAGRRTLSRADSQSPDRSRSNPPGSEDDGIRSRTSSTQTENSRTPSKSHRSETSRSGSHRSGSKKTHPRKDQPELPS
ncbi:uncharacterized protein LOC133791424 [Humulus lupulus]|uniref:uncharacterized protein LOC133791424 n=1 Tax=Humulus lupulus TaxID=3486 RepID=UPI002B4045BB|nr:uncharacterized protein LOC133791424 [Humulus lupulus]